MPVLHPLLGRFAWSPSRGVRLDPQFVEIRDRLADRGFLILSILFVPAAIMVSLRALEFGWGLLQTLQAVTWVSVVVALALRGRLSYSTRIPVLLLAGVVMASVGLLTWGLLGMGIPILMVVVIVAALFFGDSQAWLYAAASMAIVALVGVGACTGLIEFRSGSNAYNTSWSGWLTALSNFGVLAAICVVSLGRLNEALSKKIVELREEIDVRRAKEGELVRLGAAVEQSSELVVLLDVSGAVEYANPVFELITGFSLERIRGRPLADLVGGDGEAAEAMRRAIAGRGLWSGTFGLQSAFGDELSIEATLPPILGESDGVLGFASVWRNVTARRRSEQERKKLEQQLFQSQKMEAVGQLAGGIAHDFNNLLHAILGFTHLTRSQLASDDEAAENLDQVMEATTRASSMVKQLLAFSRAKPLRNQPVDLNRLVGDQLQMLGRIIGEHIELAFRPGRDLPPLVGDPTKIEQVVMNLCVNARDAMKGGGRLTLSTSSMRLDETFCRSHPGVQPGRHTCLTVADTGTGIAPEHIDRIFEPFFSTKDVSRGTGLGLATVYGIVKQHEGILDVESTPGKGTTFRVCFPSRTEEISVEIVVGEGAPPPGGTGTILLAEDDASVRRLATKLLERAGYSVLAASDGEEAVRIFDRNASSIDLALLDVVMPKRHGRSVLEHIRARRDAMPVLLLSGYSRELLDPIVDLSEHTDLLHKPMEPNELLWSVSRALGQGRPGDLR